MGVTFDYVPAGAVASNVFVEQKYELRSLGGLLIPQKIAVIGQYNSGKTPDDYLPRDILSVAEAKTLYGAGSMLALTIEALWKGKGTVPVTAFPVPDAGAGAAATGTIQITGTVTKSGTIALYIAGKRVVVGVLKDDTNEEVATKINVAVNANANLPVTSAVVTDTATLTCRWKGLTGNDITILEDLAVGDDINEPTGLTIAITDMASGATDPDFSTSSPFDNFGDAWYTFVDYPYNSDTLLDVLEAAGDARNDPSVKRQFAGVCGYVGTLANFLTALDDRNSAWTTMMPVEASPSMPLEIASAVVGVAARRAQATPGRPYRALTLPDIWPGTGALWTYAQRDQVVKAGGSTFTVTSDGKVKIEDLVTTRTQNDVAEDDDSMRWTETIANIQAKIYSIDRVYSSEPFVSGVVVDDKAVTGVDYAIRPKTVKAYAIRLIDELWVPRALTKNRDAVVAGIVSEIDSGNPNRINIQVPDDLATGLKIIAAKLSWSFTAPS